MARSETALFVPFRDLTEPWFGDVVDAVQGRCTVDLYDPALPFETQVATAFAVVDQGGWGTRKMLDAAAESGVSLWQILGTGLDHFELAYAVERGLAVANTPGKYSSAGLAEHALLLMLCFAKSIDASRANARNGTFYKPFNDDLEGRTLVIVGFGASGRELARRAGACGMRLVAVDELPIDETTAADHGLSFAGGPDDLDALLPTADYVSLHVPLTRDTRGLLDRRRLGLLRRDAVIVNVARGGLVDEDALVEALGSGLLRGAGLDVFAHEPLDPAHPLLALENVVATPHVAGGTRGTSRRRGQAVAENLVRALEGKEILDRIVSAEALTGMRTNSLKAKINAREPALGSFLGLGSPSVAELFSHAGFDWLVIETEHNGLDSAEIQQMLMATSGSSVVPLVRVPSSDHVPIQRALDIGAMGVVVPMIRSVAEVEAVVRATRYPPEGTRSFGPLRASRYSFDNADYLYRANENIVVIVILETPEAVADLERIARIPGIDGLWLGTFDLCLGLGLDPLKLPHPEIDEIVTRTLEIGREAGVAVGQNAFSAAMVRARLDEGYTMIGLGPDYQLLAAMLSDGVAAFRDAIGGGGRSS